MAISKLWPAHINKGKTAAQTFSDRLDYDTNPEKTDNGELVTGYMCEPRTADLEFLISKKEYISKTGRTRGRDDVLMYRMIQSFSPDELDQATANKIGYELALRFTRGNHAFTVSTHIDCNHVHNHITFNAINLDASRKFVNFWGSAFALRKLNDIICLEHGLSIIENPQQSKGHYGTWLEKNNIKKKPSFKEKLERLICDILNKNPTTYEEFIQMLKDSGCRVKQGKHLSLMLEGQKRPIRLRSLSADYSETAIRQRIAGKHPAPRKDPSTPANTQKFSLLIDVQNSIKAQNSPGYEKWAKLFSLKQAAKTLVFLQENKLDDLEKLAVAAQKAKDDFNNIQTNIQAADIRLKEISLLQKHIGAYLKTKDTYTQYRKVKFSKKFRAENDKALSDHIAAKEYFNQLNLKKLPTIKMLKQEYATLIAKKKKLYSGYHTARNHMQEILTARQNVEMLLNYRDTDPVKDFNREGR